MWRLRLLSGRSLVAFVADYGAEGRDGTRLNYTDIQPDIMASVDGVRSLVGTTELSHSSLVILDTADTAGLDKLTGTVNSVDTELHTASVSTAGGDQIVQLTSDTIILLIGDTSTGSSSSAADIVALMPGVTVEIYGQASALGYFIPKVILILS